MRRLVAISGYPELLNDAIDPLGTPPPTLGSMI